MKYSPLLPQVALVFAVAYACTDSTSPATSHLLLSPSNPTADALGEPPPPPVDVAVSVCTDVCVGYTGTYFSNGSTLESVVAAAGIGEEVFAGTAWLKFDNVQVTAPFATVSANARFKRHDDKKTGTGRFVIADLVYEIKDVIEFVPSQDCGSAGQICAVIDFTFT